VTASAQKEKNDLPQVIELQEVSSNRPTGPSLFDGKMGLIQSIKVNLSVTAGAAEITVEELFSLKEESILKLDRLTTDPFDIVLEGQIVARGRLVAIDDNFGISITELVAPKQP
jgi:flagellar motor switch protein FliN